MPPKFVPRERKHKVIARSKAKSKHTQSAADSNATEHIPTPKAEVEEKKRRLREELRKQGTAVSGKKAKRLEKYIETKLKKDENRELIQKLANSRIDTSLYSSTKKLGQGKLSKRELLSQALRDHQAGIDVDGKNEELLFEERTVQQNGIRFNPVSMTTAVVQETLPVVESRPAIPIGSGLKRPLETDESGNPILKKRQKRGGVKSKISFQKQVDPEPAWDGFDSDSEAEDSDDDSGSEDSASGAGDDSEDGEEEESGSGSDSDENMDGSSEEESGSEDSGELKQQRSSAFKAWASEKRNEALGYHPTSNIQNATETQKIAYFQPRAKEEDPLPEELQPSLSGNPERKAFSVLVNRTPEIEEARLKLPVVAEEQKIMEAIHNNSTVVVYGSTGSGKTTQVPQFLYEAGYGSPTSPTPGMIGVTQPRRVAAVSMSKRVADELGDHGKRVAYQIRFEGNVSADTAIKFMTDGVLLREVAQDIALRKYSAIVIDEAHERSVNTDILIGMLSRVVKLRKEMAAEDPAVKPLKLVIMSATLRITDFTENKTLFSEPPPVLQAEGRQYPVTNHFSRKTYHDYVEDAFHKISKGHRKLPPGGMLVFLTGQNEITNLMKRLRAAFPGARGTTPAGPKVRVSAQDASIEAEDIDFGEAVDDGGDWDDESVDAGDEDDSEFDLGEGEEQEAGPAKIHVLPLYSLLPTREQLRVFEPPPDGSRLIILSTNVAETSLTIPGIRYVFDCGRSKERKYDSLTGVQSFEIGWISKASASQRAGRAGRTGPGHCYKLYSSAVYERDFEEFAKPEILRMPIEGVVLQLKAMNLQHVVNFPFPTPPDRQMLAGSEKLLTYLSAIKPTGEITQIGSTMSIFPLSPRFARILLIGHLHDCLPYTIALVAGLSAAEVFIPENQAVRVIAPREEDTMFTQADRIEEDERNKEKHRFNKVQKDFCFLDDKSDAIKLLQVVGEFAHDPSEAWCQHHFVRHKVLKEISQLRRQITDLLRVNVTAFASLTFQEKLPKPSTKQVKALKQMVAAGFIDHVAIRADMSPNPPEVRRKPTRAIDVPYLTLFPSHAQHNDEDKAVYIHPASPLAHISPQECPEYIIYSYLQQSAVNASRPEKLPKTRMHALTDITGNQLAALAKGTPLLHYSKPIKDVMPKSTVAGDGKGETRECWVIPNLRAEGSGSIGWPLPARKVTQKKMPGMGWVVE